MGQQQQCQKNQFQQQQLSQRQGQNVLGQKRPREYTMEQQFQNFPPKKQHTTFQNFPPQGGLQEQQSKNGMHIRKEMQSCPQIHQTMDQGSNSMMDDPESMEDADINGDLEDNLHL